MKSIALIVINFNQYHITKLLLDSLEKYISYSSCKVFLVDNSEEEIKEELLSGYSFKIKYIFNNANLGFAEGNNVGIREAIEQGYEYIALINNDTEFVDDSLISVINLLEELPNVGVGGMVNYYFDDPEKIWQAGFTGILNKDERKRVNIKSIDKTSQSPIYCDYVPGSSMIIKREVFEKTGLLDEKYFAYKEELDFCIRAAKNGYSIAFFPFSKILHKVGLSSSSYIKEYLRMRNNLVFYSTYLNKRDFIYVKYRAIYLYLKRIRHYKGKYLKYIKVLLIALKDFKYKNLGKGSLDYIVDFK